MVILNRKAKAWFLFKKVFERGKKLSLGKPLTFFRFMALIKHCKMSLCKIRLLVEIIVYQAFDL
jgi:hypothetical protein